MNRQAASLDKLSNLVKIGWKLVCCNTDGLVIELALISCFEERTPGGPMAEDMRHLLERARELVFSTRALIKGDFELSSGKKSSYYLDSKLLSLDPEGSERIGEILYALVADANVEAVGGMAHAAIPLVTMVSNISYRKNHPLPSFYVREGKKEHGTRKRIEGHLPERGAAVAVLDDVVTTAESIRTAISAVEESGREVTKVIALLERHEGGAEALKQEYDFVSVFVTDERGNLLINYPGYEETSGALQESHALSTSYSA